MYSRRVSNESDLCLYYQSMSAVQNNIVSRGRRLSTHLLSRVET